jgi:multidrug transporter EmrE-like cation transporter
MLPFVFVVGHMSLNTVCNVCLKFSADSLNMRSFLMWQVAGNLAGFGGVLLFTALLRYIPLNIAFPLTQGLAMVGVQVIAARLLFHESLTPAQWVGTGCILAGIILLNLRPATAH